MSKPRIDTDLYSAHGLAIDLDIDGSFTLYHEQPKSQDAQYPFALELSEIAALVEFFETERGRQIQQLARASVRSSDSSKRDAAAIDADVEEATNTADNLLLALFEADQQEQLERTAPLTWKVFLALTQSTKDAEKAYGFALAMNALRTVPAAELGAIVHAAAARLEQRLTAGLPGVLLQHTTSPAPASPGQPSLAEAFRALPSDVQDRVSTAVAQGARDVVGTPELAHLAERPEIAALLATPAHASGMALDAFEDAAVFIQQTEARMEKRGVQDVVNIATSVQVACDMADIKLDDPRWRAGDWWHSEAGRSDIGILLMFKALGERPEACAAVIRNLGEMLEKGLLTEEACTVEDRV